MAPNRVLILSAAVGAGHLRAAEAVEAACRLRMPGAHARHMDVLTLTPAPFRRVYGKGYLDLVNRAPGLLGLFYDRTNRPPKRRGMDALRLAVEKLNTRRLDRFLEDFRPDVVCHTHFLPAEIMGGLTIPQAVVITDYEVHRFWLAPGNPLYLVGREENRVHLEALGVPSARVRVTGIPVDPAFAEPPDLPALRRKHGLPEGAPVLLVLCGGFGVGPIEQLAADLWTRVKGARMVVIAGRNEALRERLQGLAPKGVRVLGFTREMHEWMALSDLAVTKPGGLTTSEALARGLPMVVANPIPGQETRNAAMLYEAGAAISGENLYTVGWRVERLLKDPQRLSAMRKAAKALGKPRSALEAADALDALAAGRA